MNTAEILDNQPSEQQTHPDQGWEAELKLEFSGGPSGTRMKHSQHSGPLYVQKPFYPEGRECAHIYLLHPPGGIVSGDHLQIDISARNHARLLLTTPGAGRFYRARQQGGLQKQTSHLHVSANSSIEWFPQETIVYNQASAELETHVTLDQDSQFIGWEIACLGLKASGKPFEQGQLLQTFTVTLENRLVFIDRLRLGEDKTLFSAPCGLQNKPVSGILLAGPFVRASPTELQNLLDELRQNIETLNASHLIAITCIGQFCISRYLGDSAEQSRQLFIALWRILRPALLDLIACKPRIWYT